MAENNHNPLMVAVLQVLRTSTSALTINELMQALKQQASIPELDSDAQLALFKLNWLMMNALYQLQQELIAEGLYLKISIVEIQLQRLSLMVTASAQLHTDNLRAYYLDWQNFSQTTKEEVQALLDGVWQTFSSSEEMAQARKLLGVSAQATAAQIKQHYRQLAQQCHPDKGGDSQHFMAIRQAYEQLR